MAYQSADYSLLSRWEFTTSPEIDPSKFAPTRGKNKQGNNDFFAQNLVTQSHLSSKISIILPQSRFPEIILPQSRFPEIIFPQSHFPEIPPILGTRRETWRGRCRPWKTPWRTSVLTSPDTPLDELFLTRLLCGYIPVCTEQISQDNMTWNWGRTVIWTVRYVCGERIENDRSFMYILFRLIV